jgi:urease subunit gamma/beta
MLFYKERRACAEPPRNARLAGGIVYLTATEEDRLRIFTAAELARRARADGLALSAPEATALVCDEMHRAARAGADAPGVLAAGRAAVSAGDLMDGVPALVDEIRLEVLLDDGTRLVVLRDPWGAP